MNKLDLKPGQDWRDELAPIWAVLRPQYRWMAMDRDGDWWAHKAKPDRDVTAFCSPGMRSLIGLAMPTPDCPWAETLTERPEGI